MAKKKEKIQFTGPTGLPLIGADKDKKHIEPMLLDDKGKPVLNKFDEPKFAQKPVVEIDKKIESKAAVMIPPIYYWEDVDFGGKSNMMTMAFRIQNQNWGESLPIAKDATNATIEKQRSQLFGKVKETLDVLLHHGTKVMDNHGNIDPRLVNDEEAIRYKHDEHWTQKVAAFNKLVRIAPITRERASQLKLVDTLVV